MLLWIDFSLLGTGSSELIAVVLVRIHFYTINNHSNELILFRVIFVSGD